MQYAFVTRSFIIAKVFKTVKMSLQSDALGFQPPQERSRNLLSPNYEIRHEEQITIVSEKVDREEFSERKDLLQSPLEYARNGENPGLVLIFNQESFEDHSYRFGSRRDVNEIVTCMTRLGFNINEDNIYTDYKRDEIMTVIKIITQKNLSEVNCVIIFFLTHGDCINELHANDYSLQASDLWKEFAECVQLRDKPKMFIFQACKGKKHSTLSSDNTFSGKIELIPECTFNSNYIGPDMLIVYATTEGNVSFRDTMLGSWFIQELCKTFSAYGRRDDVLSLIIRTTKCICRNYYHNDENRIRKQMPIFISTLRKKFYLTRSKDRNILFRLLTNQQQMQKNIDEITAKVEELLVTDKEKKKEKDKKK